MTIHASCVAWNGMGVLLLGPPGAGKSDLALRLMDAGFQLVADDRVMLDDSVASAPRRLAGLIEVRGVGILRTPFVIKVPVRLKVHLGENGPRLPEPDPEPGSDCVVLRLDPGFPGVVARIRAALRAVDGTYGWVAGAGGDMADSHSDEMVPCETKKG
ncbi:HPr kinase/phosphorylase [Gluconobacter morbifer]|uniref:HPr kinase n=1 Tax=Gluconobacter morbifer G707 TaxID=1088869 RepID=G6XJV6_9PROT|nr:HPr kinase/phosphatase C-terminal domain-containing protein [Gluconobacter morbifer]EHH67918.1 HPr kinase [Gluconobacter morbifer G707]